MNLNNMLGYLIYDESEGGGKDINLLRIVKVVKRPKQFYIKAKDKEGNETELKEEDLKKYRPLMPDGYLTISNVAVTGEDGKMNKDVIVTASRIVELRSGNKFPYAICRQSINDIFAQLLVQNEQDIPAGLSINVEDCPGGYDIGMMLACDSILESVNFNFYRNDTLEDILECLNTKPFDYILEDLYNKHVKASGKSAYAFRDCCDGWCRDVKTLLKDNTFQEDINQMFGITKVDFNLEDYLVEKQLPDPSKGNYITVTDDLKLWLSGTYKVAMNDVSVVEYYHDIDLTEFQNATYLFLRDNTNRLYFVVYTIDNNILLSDLEDMYNKKDFTEQFRIDFYNKYNKNDNA